MEQINDTIRQQVAGMSDRLPMLCYALDTDLLPDDCYQALLELQNAGQLSPDMPWLLGLYWARRFYERGRGNNYLDVIGQGAFDASKLAQSVFQKWWIAGRDFPGVGNNLNLYRFLSECWLITGDQGETSRLWKALTAIVEEVPDNCEGEDVLEAIGRLRDEGFQVPAYLTWRAENGPWLAESIRAIKAGGGDGWLGVIGSNPYWKNYRQRDNATCAWGLRKDGNRVQWAIRIANVRLQGDCSIRITQSNRNLFECRGERYVLVSELGPNYDPANPLIIRAGNRRLDLEEAPFDPDRPLLFRKSRTSSFHRLIASRENNEEEGTEHIQASNLFLLPPAGQNGNPIVTLGSRQIQPVYVGQVTPNHHGPSLYEMNLADVDRSVPQVLTWNGTNLLQIGGKPYITANNVADGFALRDHPEVLVVLDNKSVLNAENLPQEHSDQDWRISGGQLQDAVVGKEVNPDAIGTIVKATCMIGNVRCHARLIFLPKNLQAAVTGLVAADGDGWAWRPEQDEYKKCAAAENGRVRGRARIGQQADYEGWEIEAPSSRPLWWWRTGIGEVESNFCLELQNITTLTDLQSKCLLVHIPAGVEASLFLNDQRLDGTSLHEGLNNLRVFDLLRDRIGFDVLGNVASLSIRYGKESLVLTQFLACPAEPTLVSAADGPAVFFPQAEQARHWHIAVIRDSSLLAGTITRIDLDPTNVVGNLHQLAVEELYQNEGCWLLLLQNARGNQAQLLGLAWELHDHIAGQGNILQIRPTCLVTPVPLLLQQWNGGQPLTGQQVEAIKQIAAFIRGGNSPTLKAIFDRFLRHEVYSSMAGQAVVATSYFMKHMEERFAIVDLLEPLSRLLHMGFNWLGEPNWISGKETFIQDRYSNPGGNGRRNWNSVNGAAALIETAPIFPAITDIEGGYPYLFKKNRVPELGEIAMIDFNGQNVPLHGVIQISFEKASHRLHGIYRDGLRGHDKFQFPAQSNQNQCVDFQYHGPRLLCGVWSAFQKTYINARYSTQVVDDNAAVGHFVNQDSMVAMDEPLLDDENAHQNLDRIFSAGINSASPAIDGYGIHGLCFLFQTCGAAFQKMADEQPGQINRSLIFRVAVLNSLNRWIGWNGAAHPAGWPLSERANADLLCGLTARIWDAPVARKTLMQDQIPVEWLLAWFHNSPNA